MWSGSERLDSGNVAQIQAVFKSHLDRHLRVSVEEAFTHSGMLMRQLISAAAIGAFPFFLDFIAYEAVKLVHHFWLSTYTNLGLGLYFLFWMPLFIRGLLVLGKVGSRWWNGSCGKRVVVACQALAMFLISVVIVVGYSVSNSIAPRLMAVCSVIFGLRHLCPCRKSATRLFGKFCLAASDLGCRVLQVLVLTRIRHGAHAVAGLLRS